MSCGGICTSKGHRSRLPSEWHGNYEELTRAQYVNLRGVGFMPRPLADRNMKYNRGIPCGHIKVLSVMELRRLLRKCHLPKRRILLPSVSPEEARQLSAVQRIQVAIYDAVKRMPVLRLLLYLIGPSFTVEACVGDK